MLLFLFACKSTKFEIKEQNNNVFYFKKGFLSLQYFYDSYSEVCFVFVEVLSECHGFDDDFLVY